MEIWIGGVRSGAGNHEPRFASSDNPHRWMNQTSFPDGDDGDDDPSSTPAVPALSAVPFAVEVPTLSGENSSVLSAQMSGSPPAGIPAPAARICSGPHKRYKASLGPLGPSATAASCQWHSAYTSALLQPTFRSPMRRRILFSSPPPSPPLLEGLS